MAHQNTQDNPTDPGPLDIPAGLVTLISQKVMNWKLNFFERPPTPPLLAALATVYSDYLRTD